MIRLLEGSVAATAALVCCALALAAATGCTGNTAAKPSVALVSSVTSGPAGLNCNRDAPAFMRIGDVGGAVERDDVRLVEDHGPVPPWIVTTKCAVVEQGGIFRVTSHIQLIGHGAGYFQMGGNFAPNELPQPNIALTVTDTTDFYSQKDCVGHYATSAQTVAPGTLWAEITCPAARAANQAPLRDGRPIECHVVTTVRLDDCSR